MDKYNIDMQCLQAFKYELMPNGEQARQMRCFVGSCRFLRKFLLEGGFDMEDESVAGPDEQRKHLYEYDSQP